MTDAYYFVVVHLLLKPKCVCLAAIYSQFFSNTTRQCQICLDTTYSMTRMCSHVQRVILLCYCYSWYSQSPSFFPWEERVFPRFIPRSKTRWLIQNSSWVNKRLLQSHQAQRWPSSLSCYLFSDDESTKDRDKNGQ